MKQRDAVYQGIRNIMTENGETFEDGGNVQPFFAKGSEFRATLSLALITGFQDGTIECTQSYEPGELKVYVSGLISNWLRKDARLNGNVKYVASNPGSRAGSGDSMLKELRKLRTVVQDETMLAEIDTHIATRVAEVAASKAKKVTIDFSKLPAELQAKLNK
jgi:hypothetical protein